MNAPLPNRFTRGDFKKFQRADDHATRESRVAAYVIPIIEGDPGDTKCVAGDIPLANLNHLITDGSLVCAKLDPYYGARPEQLPKDVRRVLGNLIVSQRRMISSDTFCRRATIRQRLVNR